MKAQRAKVQGMEGLWGRLENKEGNFETPLDQHDMRCSRVEHYEIAGGGQCSVCGRLCGLARFVTG